MCRRETQRELLSLITLHTLSDPRTPLSVDVCFQKSGSEIPSAASLEGVLIAEEPYTERRRKGTSSEAIVLLIVFIVRLHHTEHIPWMRKPSKLWEYLQFMTFLPVWRHAPSSSPNLLLRAGECAVTHDRGRQTHKQTPDHKTGSLFTFQRRWGGWFYRLLIALFFWDSLARMHTSGTVTPGSVCGWLWQGGQWKSVSGRMDCSRPLCGRGCSAVFRSPWMASWQVTHL